MMEFLVTPVMDKPLWMWAGFIGIVIALLAFDLGVLHRKTHEVSIRESLWMSAFYIAIALAFGGWVWWSLGDQAGKEYLTGFIVEKTLALDNVFVISLIFTYFAIPPLYQHRVLFWGILGVIVLRGIMIALGATLVSQYSWVLYVFAVFLIFTGIKMLFVGDKHPDIGNNPLLKLMRRVFPISAGLDEQKFLTRQPDPKTGKWRTYATPLLVALALIEFVDLIFAVDSVPAIFTITLDPFIVFTSNIFAILGLRALYFALAAIIHRFRYLKPALAIVLIFIGSKTFIADAMGL
ncbi:MAG: TerC family protein, partial [Asticcacaulis sp.]|uniref:TerC family protein n=1 Tax=Asticcacaulis sp. TaxID=1872648 RepID=UPI0025BC0CC2